MPALSGASCTDHQALSTWGTIYSGRFCDCIDEHMRNISTSWISKSFLTSSAGAMLPNLKLSWHCLDWQLEEHKKIASHVGFVAGSGDVWGVQASNVQAPHALDQALGWWHVLKWNCSLVQVKCVQYHCQVSCGQPLPCWPASTRNRLSCKRCRVYSVIRVCVDTCQWFKRVFALCRSASSIVSLVCISC